MSEWIVIAIDYCALFSTFAGNEVFAIPRRSPFPNFPLHLKTAWPTKISA